jgi:hypothetical protein
MNITYSIDKILHIVYLKYTGNPDFDEWANTMSAVFRDPDYEPGYHFIMDRRHVTTPPTTEYIESIVDFVGQHPLELGSCRTAAVVSETASYGMGRMSQGVMDDTDNTMKFTDIKEAKKWLRPQSQS